MGQATETIMGRKKIITIIKKNTAHGKMGTGRHDNHPHRAGQQATAASQRNTTTDQPHAKDRPRNKKPTAAAAAAVKSRHTPHLAACAVAGFREPGVLEVLVVVRRAGRGVVAEGHLPRRRPEHRRKPETRTATTSPRSVRRQYAQQEKHERDERFVENCTTWRQPLSGAPIVARLIRTENHSTLQQSVDFSIHSRANIRTRVFDSQAAGAKDG